jgi:DNA-binding MarR family transcriptional regulator
MDPIFFSLKRAFHGTLRIARAPLKDRGLTSARFDMLFALTRDECRRAVAVRQSVLRRILGVSRPTVSRMLQSLEDLGLVRRRRSETDRRQLVVELSDRGFRRIRLAYRHFTLRGWAMLALHAALGGAAVNDCTWLDVDPGLFDDSDILGTFLNKLRHGFGDFATLDYPSMPAD